MSITHKTYDWELQLKLVKFLEMVWGPQGKGTAFIAGKGKGGDWHEHPLTWPPEKDIVFPPKSADIYFCPNLFKGRYRRIHEVRGGHWLYADLDDVDPTSISLRPTVAWESSADRYQALWYVKRKLRPEILNDLNKRLTYLVGADKGGWDLTQVLRLPGTRNHKYDKPEPVTLLWHDGPQYTSGQIRRAVQGVDPGDAAVEVDDLVIPEVSAANLFRKHRKKIDPRARRILQAKRVVEGERSDRLWELENLLLDAGIEPEEVFVMVRDSVWNKYRGRSDETYRIWLEIQKAARTQATLEVGETDDSTSIHNPAPTGWESHDLFMQSEVPPPAWMVNGIWSDRSHGIIAGEPKGYKSLLAMDLSVSVASGTKFLGHYDTPVTGPVLVIQEENAPWFMQSRLRKIEKAHGILGEAQADATTLSIKHGGDLPIELLNQSGFDLTDPAHLDSLERKVQVVRPVLIVLDPLYLMIGDADENSNRDMRPVLQWLLHLKIRYSVGVCIVHHYSKQGTTPRYGGQRIRGAGAFHGWVESALYVEKPDHANPHYISVSREHRGQEPQGAFELEVFEGVPGEDDDYEVVVYDTKPKGELWKYVQQHPGCTVPQAKKALDKTASTILRHAEKEGVEVHEGERKKGQKGRTPRTLHIPAREE